MSQTYNAVNDVDPIETKEWVDAIRSVVENEGVERARFLLEQLLGTSKDEGVPKHHPNQQTSCHAR